MKDRKGEKGRRERGRNRVEMRYRVAERKRKTLRKGKDNKGEEMCCGSEREIIREGVGKSDG